MPHRRTVSNGLYIGIQLRCSKNNAFLYRLADNQIKIYKGVFSEIVTNCSVDCSLFCTLLYGC